MSFLSQVHISNGHYQPTTIDISQLQSALQSFSTQQGGVATVLTQPPQQPTSPNQSVTVMAQGPGGAQTINLGNTQFITRTWTNGFTTLR